MNTKNVTIPEVKVEDSALDATVDAMAGAWPFPTEQRSNAFSPIFAMEYGTDSGRLPVKLNTDPLTRDEVATYEQDSTRKAPQDWAESLTNLQIAIRDLSDAIPTKKTAMVIAAMKSLKENQEQLARFLNLRGLDV